MECSIQFQPRITWIIGIVGTTWCWTFGKSSTVRRWSTWMRTTTRPTRLTSRKWWKSGTNVIWSTPNRLILIWDQYNGNAAFHSPTSSSPTTTSTTLNAWLKKESQCPTSATTPSKLNSWCTASDFVNSSATSASSKKSLISNSSLRFSRLKTGRRLNPSTSTSCLCASALMQSSSAY